MGLGVGQSCTPREPSRLEFQTDDPLPGFSVAGATSPVVITIERSHGVSVSTPVGRIRLLCPRLAAKTVAGPKIGQFVRDYPGVELVITTDDSHVDLVSGGYDAGIQFGEYIAQDMVAVRVSPDLRPAVVGAPAYVDSHPNRQLRETC